jgi:hypothetical protein
MAVRVGPRYARRPSCHANEPQKHHHHGRPFCPDGFAPPPPPSSAPAAGSDPGAATATERLPRRPHLCRSWISASVSSTRPRPCSRMAFWKMVSASPGGVGGRGGGGRYGGLAAKLHGALRWPGCICCKGAPAKPPTPPHQVQTPGAPSRSSCSPGRCPAGSWTPPLPAPAPPLTRLNHALDVLLWHVLPRHGVHAPLHDLTVLILNLRASTAGSKGRGGRAKRAVGKHTAGLDHRARAGTPGVARGCLPCCKPLLHGLPPYSACPVPSRYHFQVPIWSLLAARQWVTHKGEPWERHVNAPGHRSLPVYTRAPALGGSSGAPKPGPSLTALCPSSPAP